MSNKKADNSFKWLLTFIVTSSAIAIIYSGYFFQKMRNYSTSLDKVLNCNPSDNFEIAMTVKNGDGFFTTIADKKKNTKISILATKSKNTKINDSLSPAKVVQDFKLRRIIAPISEVSLNFLNNQYDGRRIEDITQKTFSVNKEKELTFEFFDVKDEKFYAVNFHEELISGDPEKTGEIYEVSAVAFRINEPVDSSSIEEFLKSCKYPLIK